MTGALVIAIAGTGGSYATEGTTRSLGGFEASGVGSARATASLAAGEDAAALKCHARTGLRWYRSRYVIHVQRRIGEHKPVITGRKPRNCADAGYLAKVWKRKAFAMRQRYEQWVEYHYAWSTWLPDKWARIGACETGYGRRPGNWHHSNSSYEGAFGFAKSSWDAFKGRADRKAGPYPEDAWQATPRQQYEVALAIYRMYGLSGWGCRGA